MATDDGGPENLTYTWRVEGDGVTFSPNGSAAADVTTATFAGAGTFTLVVRVEDSGGQAVESSVVVAIEDPGPDGDGGPGGGDFEDDVNADSGCGCTSGSPGASWLLGVALLAGARRSKRRR